MATQTPDQKYEAGLTVFRANKVFKGNTPGEYLVRGTTDGKVYTVSATGKYFTGNANGALAGTCTCTNFVIRCREDKLFCKHIIAVCIKEGYTKATMLLHVEKPNVQYIIGAYAQHAADGPTNVGFNKRLTQDGTFSIDIDVNDINAYYFKGMHIQGKPNGKVTVTLMAPSKDDVVMEYDLTKI